MLLVLSDNGIASVDPRSLDATRLDPADGSAHPGVVGGPPCRRARRWPGPTSPPGGAGTGWCSPPPSRSGSAAWTTELAVEYAKQRRQFGRPIGGFQAVKHLCADMAVRAEVARCSVHAAAVTVDQPDVGDATGGRAGSQVAGRRGGDGQRAVVHPGPRGHGVHLGGPGAPGLQAGPGAGHPVRDRSTGWPSRWATSLAESLFESLSVADGPSRGSDLG